MNAKGIISVNSLDIKSEGRKLTNFAYRITTAPPPTKMAVSKPKMSPNIPNRVICYENCHQIW